MDAEALFSCRGSLRCARGAGHGTRGGARQRRPARQPRAGVVAPGAGRRGFAGRAARGRARAGRGPCSRRRRRGASRGGAHRRRFPVGRSRPLPRARQWRRVVEPRSAVTGVGPGVAGGGCLPSRAGFERAPRGCMVQPRRLPAAARATGGRRRGVQACAGRAS